MRRIRITVALLVAGSLLFTVLSYLPAFAKPITIKGKRLKDLRSSISPVYSQSAKTAR